MRKRLFDIFDNKGAVHIAIIIAIVAVVAVVLLPSARE